MKEENKHPKPVCQPGNEVPDCKYQEEMKNACRGYIGGTALAGPIPGPDGTTTPAAWNITSYDFLNGFDTVKNSNKCDTIHPNLLRQEQMNNVNGLFMVRKTVCGEENPVPAYTAYPTEGLPTSESCKGDIYQLRSYDLATMSFVRSKNGWIVIDPLGGVENVQAGLAQFRNLFPLGENRIVAVLVTHSHVDHYRGIQALLENETVSLVEPGQVKILQSENTGGEIIDCSGNIVYLAPAGFYNEAVSENLYLGNSMTRRSAYMYGRLLPHDEKHHVGSGLGKTVGTASGSLRRPSMEIDFLDSDLRTFQIDDLRVSFLDAHDSEAPSECHIYFHDYHTLCPGENITHTMHNLLTCRGAKIRNPKAFARAIDRSLKEWGADVQTIIGTHHWPVWGGESCRQIMTKQRDMYLFFNDQVIHRINLGMNMEEIAEDFRLPESLASECYNRGYYGSVNHNVKAVFQYYVGWWDGNPANYYRYPEAEAARRFVDCMGGVKSVYDKAEEYSKKKLPDYRWVIELTKQILFYPEISTFEEKKYYKYARTLAANAMTQLAYGFEAGTWRNIFLTGAQELRNGTPASSPMSVRIANSAAQIAGLAPEQAFEYMSVLVNSDAVEAIPGDTLPSVEVFVRIGQKSYYYLYLQNGVLHYEEVHPEDNEEEKQKYIDFDDMPAFSKEYEKAMTRMHTDASSAPAPAAEDDTPLDALCACLELPPENWAIVLPLPDITRLPG